MARPPLEKMRASGNRFRLRRSTSTLNWAFSLTMGYTLSSIHAVVSMTADSRQKRANGLTFSPRVHGAVAKSCTRKSTLVSSGRSMSACPITDKMLQCRECPLSATSGQNPTPTFSLGTRTATTPPMIKNPALDKIAAANAHGGQIKHCVVKIKAKGSISNSFSRMRPNNSSHLPWAS
jgi:hypothetical protein